MNKDLVLILNEIRKKSNTDYVSTFLCTSMKFVLPGRRIDYRCVDIDCKYCIASTNDNKYPSLIIKVWRQL
jgi:hypothetical protein